MTNHNLQNHSLLKQHTKTHGAANHGKSKSRQKSAENEGRSSVGAYSDSNDVNGMVVLHCIVFQPFSSNEGHVMKSRAMVCGTAIVFFM